MTTSIIFLIIGLLLVISALLVIAFSGDNEKKILVILFILMWCATMSIQFAMDRRQFNTKKNYVSKTVITKTVNGKEVKRDTLMRFELKNK